MKNRAPKRLRRHLRAKYGMVTYDVSFDLSAFNRGIKSAMSLFQNFARRLPNRLEIAREKAMAALRAGDGVEYERWMQIVRPLSLAQRDGRKPDRPEGQSDENPEGERG